MPIPGALRAAALNASSQPGGTRVSLLSSATSRPPAACIPKFAAAGNPRVRSRRCRRMRPSRAKPCSAAAKSGSGPQSSTTCRWLPGGRLASTLARQASVRSASPCTGTTTSVGPPPGATAEGGPATSAQTGRKLASNPAALRLSAAGSSGLPSRSRPSGPVTRRRPSGRSAAGTANRRGRASGRKPSAWSSRPRKASVRVVAPAVVAPAMVMTGSRSGSPGCHAQPEMPPPRVSTKPSVAAMAARSIGLPSRAWPSRVASSRLPGGRRQAPALQRGCRATPSSATSGAPSARSRPADSQAHHPVHPAAAATAAANCSAAPDAAWRDRQFCIALAAPWASPSCRALAAQPSQASPTSCRAATSANSGSAAAGSAPCRRASARRSATVPSSGASRRARSSDQRAGVAAPGGAPGREADAAPFAATARRSTALTDR